ncbi:hypothetical protein [Ochrobactrum chromiisoli]|uniref:DUF551 domain-containing protein n=1 Tax=Ochrobactrum chromiisoli TaxID=2993941 RepID=A0ABT3QUQ1_9HYPH|nr:hypothetical protein [Ochrobactrum chromiisoli]MCX2699356.1 hypothetical protein [Ochrobactrum chromiisoli]
MTPTIQDEAVQADKALWCVNIKGPDDIISAPDYLSAVRMANTFNAWWLDLITKTPLKDNHPHMWAEPIEWPYSEGHGEDVTDTNNEYQWLRELTAAMPFLTGSPSPRAQALEEAAILEALEECEAYFDDRSDADHDETGFVPNEEMRILVSVRAAIRALSQPVADHVADAGKMVADGWLPIETAPKDGTEFIGWDGKRPFRCSNTKHYVKYPHEEGGPTYRNVWSGHYYDSIMPENPTHWRPLPASPGAPEEPFPQPRRKDGGELCPECHLQLGETCDICGATRPTGGSNHGE